MYESLSVEVSAAIEAELRAKDARAQEARAQEMSVAPARTSMGDDGSIWWCFPKSFGGGRAEVIERVLRATLKYPVV